VAPELPQDELIAGETLLGCRDGVTVLDVRLPEDRAKAPAGIAGAQWCPPARLANWGLAQARSRPIVVYCVYGFQVSGEAVATLRGLGLTAHRLAGGLAAWRALGGEMAEVAAV
jgi:Fe-Mn family superoxide dismutase